MDAGLPSTPIPITATAAKTREAAIRLHPSNHTPSEETAPAIVEKDDLTSRWQRRQSFLVCQGLTDQEARTEVARIGTQELWQDLAGQLRTHRAEGRQIDANVLAVVLASMKGVTAPLTRHPGDVVAASNAIISAARRLRRNSGRLDRLHDHCNPAFIQAQRTFDSLTAFLTPWAEESIAA